jgi:hypothetical protein
MTANELAQLLFKRWNGDDVEIPPNLDDLCSEMLRQQQAEIEMLKKELALQRLSDIGQEIEQEPVAWMHTNSKQLFATTKPSKRDLHLFTPLYTQPMRELTDASFDHIKFAREILKKVSEK